MAAVKWSSEQKKIIDSREQTLLVAAAAGSGKTAVLVERILSRISDEASPVDIDHFLVVTFTNAAAAQMRERLDSAMEERLLLLDEKSEAFRRLKRQQMLLGNAQISTIHQFCLSIIRNHFNKLNIDPAFRVGDEGELRLLKSDIVDELLEKYYLEGAEEFYDLTESICTGKNDEGLSEVILKLYEASISHPDPKGWLNGVRSFYDIENEEDFENLPEIKYLLEYKDTVLQSVIGAWNRGLRAVLSDSGLAPYVNMYNSDRVVIDDLMSAKSYTDTVTAWERSKGGFITMPRIKAGSADTTLQEEAKECRDIVKSELKKLMDDCFVTKASDAVSQIKALKSRAEMLIKLTEEFGSSFAVKKREKNLVDFNDLEHFALEILLENFMPTAVADEYSEFFCEIMVDEYQDSNMVQEAIINAVSGERFGRDNVFMVGDVKQSIYKFRMARPDLFLGKYDAFSREDNAPKQCIELNSNYRSRSQVLSAANSIFENIMNKRFGGIEYDEASALKCGMRFEEGVAENNYVAELHLVDRAVESDEKQKEDGAELEAKIIAKRIRELVAGKDDFKVWDKSLGAYRKCEYGDIVILLRSLGGRADTYVKVLLEEGIPAFSQSGTGYFEAYEVQTIINLLRILDNPLDDIAFAAVLHSPIGKVSSEELSIIKIEQPNADMHEAAVYYSENGENARLKNKLEAFFEKYEELRDKVAYMPLHKLIRTALKVTGYDDYCAAMPAGEKRRMNLYMLVQKAVEFEGTSYRGLFNFVRYLDKLKKYEIDYGEATTASESGAVRIMTIHKSKGLEFPVVFLGGIGKRFNQQDTSEKIVIHADYGIGFDMVDTKKRTSEPVLKRTVLKNIIKKENLEEELRVLYVALTRAIEKLILVGSFTKLEDKCVKWSNAEADFLTLMAAGSYADWVVPFSGREFVRSTYSAENVLMNEEERQVAENVREEYVRAKDAGVVISEDARRLIEERFSYRYSQAESVGVNAAVSVSELKRLSYVEEEEDVNFLMAEEEPCIVPKFMQEKLAENAEQVEHEAKTEERNDMGMLVGTAYHTVLWKFDFTNSPGRDDIQAVIEELIANGSIAPEVAKRVQMRRLLAFKDSELYKRMSEAHRKGKLRREQPFVLGMDAKTVREDWPEGELILVQGIIDAFFEEDGELVLVDYKTDRVTEEDCASVLTRRYKKQMELYSQALRQITGKKVKERVLYSLAVGRGVEV